MGSSNIRDILTSFSPSSDLLAIGSGDGRIKIWDTLKGQIQTEFADILAINETSIITKPERGHLSIDYTCMKWLSLEKKRKRKLGSSILVLGTGNGDVLALDVSAGSLRWRVSDCHPGGVSAISFSAHGSCVYTAGADGMLCEIDSSSGNLLRKFKASSKAISCMSVSSDGKILATAAGQLKIFDCSNHRKMQKFSGHPGAVRCMIFTEDGKYALSSAVGERYVAVWRIDGVKKQSSSCLLAMEHPAVFLDSRVIDGGEGDGTGIYVLAISEIGVCYYWYGQNLEDLRRSKATKVSASSENISLKNQKGSLPTIFAAKLQGVTKPGSGQVLLAQGLLVKPFFQKIVVHSGTDIKLNSSQDGVLLPMTQSLFKSKKGFDALGAVTALDRANAEDALLPIPKVFNSHETSNRQENWRVGHEKVMAELVGNQNQAVTEDDILEVDSESICMEDKLRSLGILESEDDLSINSLLNSAIIENIDLEANIPQKKLRAAVMSLTPGDAAKLLRTLVATWKSRAGSGKYVLPWIYSLLLNHGHHVISEEPVDQILDSLLKFAKSRGAAVQPLLQLSGRLQLVTTQIQKASQNRIQISTHDHQLNISEDEDEEVDDVLYGEEEYGSQLSSDEES